MREGGGRGLGQDDLGVGSRAGEVTAHLRFEIAQDRRLDVELPLEIAAHLALHLVDLAEGEHALAHDAPGLVGVGVVTDNLGCNHER